MKKEFEATRNIRLLRIMSLYAVAAVIILIITVYSYKKSASPDAPSESVEAVTVTEYVYVNRTDYETESDLESTDTQICFLVREHIGMIGIFDADGGLVDVIETYIYTLPEADQRLLEEGIEIYSISELNSIIEDYS